MCVCVCVCMFVCMYASIYTYIHTHIFSVWMKTENIDRKKKKRSFRFISLKIGEVNCKCALIQGKFIILSTFSHNLGVVIFIFLFLANILFYESSRSERRHIQAKPMLCVKNFVNICSALRYSRNKVLYVILFVFACTFQKKNN